MQDAMAGLLVWLEVLIAVIAVLAILLSPVILLVVVVTGFFRRWGGPT